MGSEGEIKVARLDKRGQTFILESAGVEAGAKAEQEAVKATMAAARPSILGLFRCQESDFFFGSGVFGTAPRQGVFLAHTYD